jgi:hypothetical protein
MHAPRYDQFMKRFLLVAIGTAVAVACGGSSNTDITDTSGGAGDSGSADGNTTGSGDGSTTGGGDSGGANDGGGNGGDASGSGSEAGANEAGKPCTIDAAGASVGCNGGEFCYSSDCTTGVCVAKPSHTSNTTYNPQCGCDGVTYWNKEYATVGGESISASGVCTTSTTPKALACQTGQCPKGSSYGCASEMVACGVLPPQLPEYCWFLPESSQCPDSPKVQSCGSSIAVDGGITCIGLCSAIDSKMVFARNATCN